MTYPRFIFGIMQCVLALLLLAGGPNQSHPSHGATIQFSLAGADLAISDAQPHKGAIKREAEQHLGIKRDHWPTPKALTQAQPKASERASIVEARYCIRPPLDVERHRPCASPPTGPPSS